jgi:hypothetical protein
MPSTICEELVPSNPGAFFRFLCEMECDIHCTNSFGCNAVLWCAQGKGDVSTMVWLQQQGCNVSLVNNNGHGVVHKAAQRGQRDICVWFFENIVALSCVDAGLKLVGPDTERYCPSDLAGMEGYEDLARWLALNEMALIRHLKLKAASKNDSSVRILPEWLSGSLKYMSMRISESEQYTWERYGGVQRMRSELICTSTDN